MGDVLSFEFEEQEYPVQLFNKTKGVKDNFVLRPLTGPGYVEYNNAQMDKVQLDPESLDRMVDSGGKPKIISLGSTASLEPLLVSLCLYKKDKDKEVRVTQAEVGTFPVGFIQMLYKKCLEINNLDKKGDEKTKN